MKIPMEAGEEFTKIIGYDYYYVSNYGKIFSSFTGKLRKLKNKSNGYLSVDLCLNGKHRLFYVHRLVAMSFINNEHGKPHVNHIDCNKQNNRVDNLEWVSQSENMQHAVNNGLTRKSRYSEDDIKLAAQMAIDGIPIADIKISFNSKSYHFSKRVFAYLDSIGKLSEYNSRNRDINNTRITLMGIEKSVCILLLDSTGNIIKEYPSYSSAGKDLGISPGHIYNFILGKTSKCKGYNFAIKKE